jgi:hypothetical protein
MFWNFHLVKTAKLLKTQITKARVKISTDLESLEIYLIKIATDDNQAIYWVK